MSSSSHGLTAQHPLMQPIPYNGQTYFTSHYFHQQYRLNKPEGKYSRQADFMRLFRSLETYDHYVKRGDIIELDWNSFKIKANAKDALVVELFKANFFRPLMLINATAQVALTHHLDDEISKHLSVAANAHAAASPQLAAAPSARRLTKQEREAELAEWTANLKKQARLMREIQVVNSDSKTIAVNWLKHIAADLGIPASIVTGEDSKESIHITAEGQKEDVPPLAYLAAELPKWANAEDKLYWYFNGETLEIMLSDYDKVRTLKFLRDKGLLKHNLRQLTYSMHRGNPLSPDKPSKPYVIRKFTIERDQRA